MITLELDLCSSVAMGENFVRFSNITLDSLEKFKNEFSKILEELIR